jgi:PAS domain S-box-containing protein
MAGQKLPHESNELLKTAEEVMAEDTEKVSHGPLAEDLDHLKRELSVHEIELEVQNEELQRSWERLEESRREYADLYEFAPVGYLTFDEKGIITKANLTAASLLGIERSFLVKTPFINFVHPESHHPFYLYTQNVLKAAITLTCQLVLQRKNGAFFDAQLESIAVRVDGTTTIRTILTDIPERKPLKIELERAREELEERVKERTAELQTEITERRRMEKAMRESETRYRIMGESVDYGVWATDAEGKAIHISESFCDMVGKSFEEMRELGWLDILVPEQREEVADLWMHSVKTGEPFEHEHHFISKGGESRIVLARGKPVRNENGKIVSWAGINLDITDRKLREKRITRLTQLHAMLSRVNEAIVRTRDQGLLYEEVCRIIAQEGSFPLVWIGEVRGRHVAPVVSCGPAVDYLAEVRIETDGVLGQGPTGICVREDRPVVNDDFDTNASTAPWRESALRRGFRASAAFPLRCQSRVVGVLTLYATQAYDFDAEQIGLIEALSADISYALDAMEQEKLRAKAEAELHHTLNRFGLLAHTAGELLQSPDPQKLVNSLCREVMGHLGCHAFFNFIADEDAGRLKLNAYAGIQEEEAEKIAWLNYGVAVCGCAAQDACRIVAEHIPTTPDPRTELIKSYGIKAYACHPLFAAEGKVIGTLSFGSRDRETFNDEDLSLMKAVADQVSVAIIRVRDVEALRRSRDELEQRVQERTTELTIAYDRLREETNERTSVEAQLRQAVKMEALGTLTGGIAHDFNNILTAIIGFAELAKDRALKGSRQAQHLLRVLEAGTRGRDLVRQLLTFSRKAEGGKEPLRLGGLVKEAMKLLRASIPSTITTRVTIDDESGVIFADPTQIQQVLMNLCANATHAMQGKGGSLDIELSDYNALPSNASDGMKPGAYARLVVRDTGAGIPADILEKIFDPFFTTKAQGEGTGLGLAVVHGIVTHHDGYVTVESEPGGGATFTVYFPKVVEQPTVKTVSEESIPTGHERILFIDDEAAIAEMGQEMLSDLGYRVVSKTSSREALAILRLDPSRFDIVVTDQTMPELTGLELAKEILAIRADIPVILCTGFSHLINEESAREAGIKAFLAKPMTKKEIAKTIRGVVDG